MTRVYQITGPLPVNGRKPGDTINRDELTDPDFLEAIGYITPVKKTSAKKAEDDGEGLVESTTDSNVDSTTDTKQETR